MIETPKKRKGPPPGKYKRSNKVHKTLRVTEEEFAAIRALQLINATADELLRSRDNILIARTISSTSENDGAQGSPHTARVLPSTTGKLLTVDYIASEASMLTAVEASIEADAMFLEQAAGRCARSADGAEPTTATVVEVGDLERPADLHPESASKPGSRWLANRRRPNV